MSSSGCELSVVIPCHNEVDNLVELVARLAAAFPPGTDPATEFILVDDGSTDGSAGVLTGLADQQSRLVPVVLPARVGQTRALWHGLQAARGRWIGHLDGDLQNDPADLPEMYRMARGEGLDAVLGYRLRRHDSPGRRLASRFANGVRRLVLHDSIQDVGCSTRIVRRAVLDRLPPVENQHRYLPALIELGGWRIAQVPAAHRERTRGSSKYGNLDRGLQGLRDLPRMKAYIDGLQGEALQGALTWHR